MKVSALPVARALLQIHRFFYTCVDKKCRSILIYTIIKSNQADTVYKPLHRNIISLFHFLSPVLIRCFFASMLGVILIFFPFGAKDARAESFTCEQIKAAMLIKFTDFIAWPETAFEKTPGNFVIGILGDPRIFNLLSPLSGKKIQGRSLNVIRLEEWNPPGQTIQMLYMDSDAVEKWEKEIRADDRRGILTVSDSPGFLETGGMLRFTTKPSGQIGFAVNRTVQQRSKLVFSAALLRLAEIRQFDKEAVE